MKGIVITAGNITTPLGDIDSTWNAMVRLESGLRKRHIPCCDTDYCTGLIEELGTLYGTSDRLTGLLDLILKDIRQKVGVISKDTQLFVATTKGAVDQLVEGDQKPDGQPWQLGHYLQSKLSLTGRVSTVSAACASGSMAIIQGAMAVASGRCKKALIIGIDLVAEFVLAGFDSLKALSPQVVRPFDRNRDGLALADGGGWALITSVKAAEESGLSSRAAIAGWGVACDARHITAPCREGSGLKRALEQVFSEEPMDLGGINGHGTATVYNDAMEMLVFRQTCRRDTPYCSVKGALGHSLGAAGLVEAMLSVKSLQEMVLPPTVGLQIPDSAAGSVSGEKMLPLLSPTILTCNSGFGGINTAILLSAI